VRALVADEGAVLVGGWFHGALVGIGVARAEPTGSEPSSGTVTLLYVEPEARGVGVGEALLTSLVGWCADRGCRGVDVDVLPGDRPTKAVLEQTGFVARKIVMHKPLG
jgi:GNAT superfamily N-acetyltransferase